MLEDLGNNYETFEDFRQDIEHIQVPKKPFSSKKALFSEKVIAFLYSSMISFCRTNKVKSIPLSKKFIKNLKSIMKNSHCKHHFFFLILRFFFFGIIIYSHKKKHYKVYKHYNLTIIQN